MEAEKFTVRVDRDRFFRGFDGQYVDVTDTPSYAQIMTYEAAASWAARLRKKGFPQALVAGTDGQVMTYERLQQTRQSIREEVSNLPTSYADLDKMTAAEVHSRYKIDAVFAQRVDEIESTPRVVPGRRS